MTGTIQELLERNGARCGDFPAMRAALVDQLSSCKVTEGEAMGAMMQGLLEERLSLKEYTALQSDVSRHISCEGRKINLQLRALRLETKAERIANRL